MININYLIACTLLILILVMSMNLVDVDVMTDAVKMVMIMSPSVLYCDVQNCTKRITGKSGN